MHRIPADGLDGPFLCRLLVSPKRAHGNKEQADHDQAANDAPAPD
jgi:hypothetical protein